LFQAPGLGSRTQVRSTFDQISIGMHKLRSQCTKSLEFARNWIKFARNCSKFDQICSKFVHICSKFGQIFSKFDRHAQICTNTPKSAFRALTSSLFEGARFSKFDEKLLRQGFTTEPHARNSRLSFPDATWRRFWSPGRAPGSSWAPIWTSRGAFRDPPGAPGARREHADVLPGCSQGALGTLLGATGRPEGVHGPILTRFRVPRRLSRD
jgi:hypothetical protein